MVWCSWEGRECSRCSSSSSIGYWRYERERERERTISTHKKSIPQVKFLQRCFQRFHLLAFVKAALKAAAANTPPTTPPMPPIAAPAVTVVDVWLVTVLSIIDKQWVWCLDFRFSNKIQSTNFTFIN